MIGLMLGDVTGIGPEISARLLASGVANELANVVVIGDQRVLDLGIQNAGVELGYRMVPSVDAIRWPSATLPVIDLGNIDPAHFKQGESSAESGRLTGETLKYMIDLALCRQDRRHLLRAAQQGRPSPGRLEVSRRAPDVRKAHRSRRLLRRDERDQGIQHLPRDLARRAARGGQSGDVRAHRERDTARRRNLARSRPRPAAYRRRGAQSAQR